MAYRNGTYVAFHARATSDPTASDMKYYNLLRAWHVRDDNDFKFVNSHEKAGVTDSASKERLRNVLRDRLNNSKNMILILGTTTRFDTDWVPFEIEHAIDKCGLPIIAVYPDCQYIMAPWELSAYWPPELAARIQSGTVRAIHIPFRREPLVDAIGFDLDNLPQFPLTYYSREAYQSFGIDVP